VLALYAAVAVVILSSSGGCCLRAFRHDRLEDLQQELLTSSSTLILP